MSMERWTLWARRWLPWGVAAALMTLLVRRIGVDEIVAAFSQADVVFLLLATLVCTVVNFSLDVLSLSRCFSWFQVPLSFTQLAPVKGAAYLVAILNYNVASGGIAFWVARRFSVPFLEAASTLLFVNVVDALLLVALMTAGLAVLREPLATAVQTIAVVAVVGFVAQFVFWRFGERWPLLGRIWGWPIFASFRRATLAHYAGLAVMRLAFLSVFIGNYWLAVRAFGLEIPLLQVIAGVPVISFVGIIPVTVAGLGTVQAATIYMFRDYASEASLLALSLAVTGVMTALRALLGLPFFAQVSGELIAPSSGEPQDGSADSSPTGSADPR